MLGLENTFHDIDGWAQISQEQIIERNPDYIVTLAMYYGALISTDEIMGRPGWSDITAIQNEHVFYIDSNEITRPSPRLMGAATDLYTLIYES